jgi:hypothetical protein
MSNKNEVTTTEIRLDLPKGIIKFLEDHQQYLRQREGCDSTNQLLEKLIRQGFNALIGAWHLNREETYAKYKIQEA